MRARAVALRRTLLQRVRSEDGFILPVAVMITALGLIAVAVASMSSLRSEAGASRDEQSKEAFAAAEATALWAADTYRSSAATYTSCNPWCSVTSPAVGSTSTRAYMSQPAAAGSNGALRTVGVATVGDVTRRVLIANPVTTTPGAATPFATAGVIARRNMYIDADALVRGNVAIGDSSMPYSPRLQLRDRASICGTLLMDNTSSRTLGNSTRLAQTCEGATGGTPVQGTPPQVPDVTVPSFTPPSSFPTCSSSPNTTCATRPQQLQWNASRKELLINSDDVYINSDTFVLCRLTMNGGTLYMKPGGTLYFDSPQNCNGQTSPYHGNAGTYIQAGRYGQSGVDPTDFKMLIAGSPSTDTTVTINGNIEIPSRISGGCKPSTASSSKFIFYAPYSTLYMNSSARVCGRVAAKQLHLQSNSNTGIYAPLEASNWSPGGGGTPTTTWGKPTLIECNANDPGRTNVSNAASSC